MPKESPKNPKVPKRQKRNQSYRWTVMIYLAGDNNLTDECVHQLTQMKEVDGLEDICVLAQFDPRGSRLTPQRYKISHMSQTPSLSEDFKDWVKNKKKFKHESYKEYAFRWGRRSGPGGTVDEETNTGSPVTLFDFVTWGIQNYKADSYMLVLAGHGGGTEKGYLLRDENPGDALTIWEMLVALEAIEERNGVTIDVLGMDSCLMTMAEVSYQLRDRIKLLVGSEGYSPIAGWPYKQVLQRMRDDLRGIPNDGMAQTRELERQAVARGIVEEYVNYYLDYTISGMSVEQSALDLREINGVKARIDDLAIALRKELSNDRFKKALVYSHWEAQSFNGEQFVDLYDFCELLKRYYPAQDIKEACDGVLATERSFVQHSCYSGPTYQYARGVSIYFPWAEIDPNYYAVRFSRQGRSSTPSAWTQFLKEYVIQTRRPPRHLRPNEWIGDNSDPYTMRHAPDRHAPDRSLLPEILSMRNPPLAAGLSPCVRVLRAQKRRSLRALAAKSKTTVRLKGA